MSKIVVEQMGSFGGLVFNRRIIGSSLLKKYQCNEQLKPAFWEDYPQAAGAFIFDFNILTISKIPNELAPSICCELYAQARDWFMSNVEEENRDICEVKFDSVGSFNSREFRNTFIFMNPRDLMHWKLVWHGTMHN